MSDLCVFHLCYAFRAAGAFRVAVHGRSREPGDAGGDGGGVPAVAAGAGGHAVREGGLEERIGGERFFFLGGDLSELCLESRARACRCLHVSLGLTEEGAWVRATSGGDAASSSSGEAEATAAGEQFSPSSGARAPDGAAAERAAGPGRGGRVEAAASGRQQAPGHSGPEGRRRSNGAALEAAG